MPEEKRIIKDIQLFEQNIKLLEGKTNRPIGLAKDYYTDAKYYLDKKDFFTAFGCINYAHGLLDAVRMLSQSL